MVPTLKTIIKILNSLRKKSFLRFQLISFENIFIKIQLQSQINNFYYLKLVSLYRSFQKQQSTYQITQIESDKALDRMEKLNVTKIYVRLTIAIFLIIIPSYALIIGDIKDNTLPTIPIQIDGSIVNAKLVIESSWHWIHSIANSSKSCYKGSGWNPQVCWDPKSCWENCAIQGLPAQQLASSYGVSVSQNQLTINYVTDGNTGSRVYVVDPSGQKYVGFNMLARQFSFDADVSEAGCGLNSGIYFSEMPLDGGPNLSFGAPPSVGLGYCDAQCPTRNFINGKASGFQGYYTTGACCAEFDVWEANNQATQMATHTCQYPGLYQCDNDIDCGRGDYENKGLCDQYGTTLNPFRSINKKLYGTGSNYSIDTTKPFTVKTQFITDDGTETGTLIEIKRVYVQNGVNVYGGSITDSKILQNIQHNNLLTTTLGLKSMGQAFKRKMVLTFSLWDDYGSHMLWLDGVYPPGSTEPWAQNGPCPADSGNPDVMRNQVPNSKVKYSNLKVSYLDTLQPQQYHVQIKEE